LGALQNSLTVKEETIDDALAAVAVLRQTGKVDRKKIYVLGHSLGGMLVPRIGIRDAGIAGFVIFAGATRPLEDMMLEQLTYIAGLKGSLTDADKKRLDEVQKQVEKVKRLTESDVRSSESILGVAPSYWLDLRGYDPPAIARTLDHRLFVVQGERDYQVTMKDFDRWKSALAGKKNVELKTYPKLNHLFLEGEGTSTPSEYDKASHVPSYVIDDIAQWLKK
jgi:dienelactone hydrolase